MKKMYLFFFIIGFLLSCRTTDDSVNNDGQDNITYDMTLDQMARSITDQLNTSEVKRIAILEFADPAGETGKISTLLTNQFISSIFQIEHSFSIVERQNLQALMDEHNLGYSGLIDESTASEIGMFTGADVIAISGYNRIEDFITIDTRFVNVETGEILAAASGRITDLSQLDYGSARSAMTNEQRDQKKIVKIFSQNFAYGFLNPFMEILAEDTAREMGNIEVQWEFIESVNIIDELHAVDQTAHPGIILGTNSDMDQMREAGYIQKVNGMTKLGEIDKAYLEANEYGGNLWAVPYLVGNHLMLYYNKSLVDKPPETIDDYLNLRSAIDPRITPLVFHDTQSYYFVPWYLSFGGRIFSGNGYIPALANKSMIDACNFFIDLYDNDVIPPFGALSYSDVIDYFYSGKAAMIVMGDWEFDNFLGHFKADLGVAVLPGETCSMLTTKSVALSDSADELEREFFTRFVEKLLDDDIQEMFLTHYNRFPTKGDYSDHWIFDYNDQLLNSYLQMKKGVHMRGTSEMKMVWNTLQEFLPQIFQKEGDVESMVLEMQKQVLNEINNR